jgi:hypothetical protein
MLHSYNTRSPAKSFDKFTLKITQAFFTGNGNFHAVGLGKPNP